MPGNQGRVDLCPHSLGEASGALSCVSQSGSCSQSASGPSLPMLHFLAKGLLPISRLWLLSPGGPVVR